MPRTSQPNSSSLSPLKDSGDAHDGQSVTLRPTNQRSYSAWSLRIARVLSDLFTPPWVMLGTQTALTLHAAGSSWRSWVWIGVSAVSMSIAPYANVLLKVRRGRVTDRHLRQHRQRTGPVLFGLACCALGLAVLLVTHAPVSSTAFMVATIVNFAVLLLITRHRDWKISLHAGVVASSAALLGSTFGPAVGSAALAVVAATCWGRVHMRDHTVGQVLAGAASGTVTLCAVYYAIVALAG